MASSTSEPEHVFIDTMSSAQQNLFRQHLSDGDRPQRSKAQRIQIEAGLINVDFEYDIRDWAMVTPDGRLYLP